MDLNTKFQDAASSNAIKISSMKVDRKYPIIKAERVTIKCGPTVLRSIKESPNNIVKVLMPKRYRSVFLDDDIESINSLKVALNLIHRVMCEKSKSYISAI
jgi:hypothetical protein